MNWLLWQLISTTSYKSNHTNLDICIDNLHSYIVKNYENNSFNPKQEKQIYKYLSDIIKNPLSEEVTSSLDMYLKEIN